MKTYLCLLIGLRLCVSNLGAQTFTVLDNFTNAGTPVYGDNPSGPLAVSGNMLYGTTQYGGTGGGVGYGVVYSAGVTGSPGLTVLHSFTNSPDGAYPAGGLLLANGVLYGTASSGGTGKGGTVFSIGTNGDNFSVLHSFVLNTNIDGAAPLGRLVLTNGVLYGTTQNGGANGAGVSGFGTVFSLTTNGQVFKILHSFTIGYDGRNPQADLTLSGGTLYGTTSTGGTNASSQFCDGTVFAMDTNGLTLTVLHTFTNTPDGSEPVCGLVLAGGMLYGTTDVGGTNIDGYGTVFAVGTNGNNYAVLHNFNDPPDGEYIQSGLVLIGNTLYGTASGGGIENSTYGTLFSIGTDGSNFTPVHGFENGTDGQHPGALVSANGLLYGTAQYGDIMTGGPSDGLVFSLSVPATPIPLTIQPLGMNYQLSWDDLSQAFSLQASTNVTGVYTNIPFATPPYIYPGGKAQMFFRLKAN